MRIITYHWKDVDAMLLKRIYNYRYIYLLLMPGLLFFVIFKYVPIYGIQLAFKNFVASLGIMGSPFIGLEHFHRLMGEPDFWNSILNTLIISAMKLAVGFPVPIILTLLINEIRSNKFKRFYQTIITIPHFLSWVIVSGICFTLFSSTGAINGLLTTFGFEKTDILTNPGSFRWLLVLTAVWKDAGWSTILYLAALTSIDKALYEAATIDGANRFQKMLYITIPGISEMIIVNLIMSMGHIMDGGFDQIFNMYNPAVLSVADNIDTYVYRISFEQTPNFGFSTAVGLFKGVCNMIMILVADRVVKLFGREGII